MAIVIVAPPATVVIVVAARSTRLASAVLVALKSCMNCAESLAPLAQVACKALLGFIGTAIELGMFEQAVGPFLGKEGLKIDHQAIQGLVVEVFLLSTNLVQPGQWYDL